MGCGASIGVFIGQYETKYVDVAISSHNICLTAKQRLSRLDTRMFENTHTLQPDEINETQVMIAGIRASAYKGDVVNIDCKILLTEVLNLYALRHGMELHLVISPNGSQAMAERFVIGSEDGREYTVRYDDPQTMTQMEAALCEPLSPLSPKSAGGTSGTSTGDPQSPKSTASDKNRTSTAFDPTADYKGPRMSLRGSKNDPDMIKAARLSGEIPSSASEEAKRSSGSSVRASFSWNDSKVKWSPSEPQ